MPVRPNILERLAFFRLGLAPAPLLDVFGAFSFRVLLTGLRCGVFDALDEPRTVAHLSAALGVDEDSLAAVLEALAAVGYVERSADVWINTPITERWLTANGRSGVRSGVEYWGRLLDGPLADIDMSVGDTTDASLYEWLAGDTATADIFQEWMLEITALAGQSIISKIKVGTATSLLDVGGGHGWYSIELCRRNQQLTATILDHPNATRHTSGRIHDAGLDRRVGVINGDYMTHTTEDSYDMVLMFNILHGHQSHSMVELLRRSRGWLTESGRLFIVEQFPVKSGMGRASTALLGLAYNQLLDGQVHTYQSIRSALETSGYGRIKQVKLRRAPGNAVIEARTR